MPKIVEKFSVVGKVSGLRMVKIRQVMRPDERQRVALAEIREVDPHLRAGGSSRSRFHEIDRFLVLRHQCAASARAIDSGIAWLL